MSLIYFLVNNDYQYIEASRLAIELHKDGHKTALIVIPHNLSLDFNEAIFKPIISFSAPVYKVRWKAWLIYLSYLSRLRTALKILPNDYLFIFTEFELLNQIVAVRFKECNASVFIVEDGGVGTYIPLTIIKAEEYTLNNYLNKFFIRLIPGLSKTHFTKFDGTLFPMLDDRNIDGICVYRQITTSRSIRVNVIARQNKDKINICVGRVVFLNQPLYIDNIQTEEKYKSGLLLILNALCSGFSEVLFKFHPREPSTERVRIKTQILDSFPNLKVVDSNEPFEKILEDVCPEVLASYNSTPLLNLKGTGIQPLFVYHLLPDLLHSASFQTMHIILKTIGYEFAPDWINLATGYNAGEYFDVVEAAMPLSQLLEPNI
jgi:hypothetical protein